MRYSYHEDWINKACPIEGRKQQKINQEQALPIIGSLSCVTIIKVPVVLTEKTLEIVLKGEVSLNPPAVEIKRVKKDVVLSECKLVPVEFGKAQHVDGFEVLPVKRAKLFVEGFIRQDIEYATAECKGVIHDRIAKVPFSGLTEISTFLTSPIFVRSTESESLFINSKNNEIPRLDKAFFENSVYYNEQPYCELVRAHFFELDSFKKHDNFGEPFRKLKEKIVMNLTLKVLQVRQVPISPGKLPKK